MKVHYLRISFVIVYILALEAVLRGDALVPYQDCKHNICLGLGGQSCIKEENCKAVVIVRRKRDIDPYDYFENDLYLDHAKPLSYVSLGISADPKMGNDAVVDCLLVDNGNVILRRSVNYIEKEKPSNLEEVLTEYDLGKFVKVKEKNFKRDLLFCRWKSELYSTTVGSKHDETMQIIGNHSVEVDWIGQSYYLMLATGKVSQAEKGLLHHGPTKVVTNKPIAFNFSADCENDIMFKSKYCISLERESRKFGCQQSVKQCDLQFKITVQDGNTFFQLRAVGNYKNDRYIAVGLSFDKLMGGDLVTDVLNFEFIETSFNVKQGTNEILGEPDRPEKLWKVEGVRDVLWRHLPLTEEKSLKFDTSSSPFYIFIVSGKLTKNKEKQKHDAVYITEMPLVFPNFGELNPKLNCLPSSAVKCVGMRGDGANSSCIETSKCFALLEISEDTEGAQYVFVLKSVFSYETTSFEITEIDEKNNSVVFECNGSKTPTVQMYWKSDESGGYQPAQAASGIENPSSLRENNVLICTFKLSADFALKTSVGKVEQFSLKEELFVSLAFKKVAGNEKQLQYAFRGSRENFQLNQLPEKVTEGSTETELFQNRFLFTAKPGVGFIVVIAAVTFLVVVVVVVGVVFIIRVKTQRVTHNVRLTNGARSSKSSVSSKQKEAKSQRDVKRGLHSLEPIGGGAIISMKLGSTASTKIGGKTAKTSTQNSKT